MSPEYFMHTLTFKEAALYLDGFYERCKREWGRAKYEAFWSMWPHLKDFRYENMPKFSWEKDVDAGEEVDKQQQLEELAELRKRARERDEKYFKNVINGGR